MTTEPKRGPSEGIYYVVREPAGWQLAVQIFPPGEDHTHQEMWECDLVPVLARQWAEKLHEASSELQSLFKLLTFAFPRGRVTKVNAKYVVYHGNDLQPFMRVTKKAVEEAFGIVGHSRWIFDDHERCMSFAKQEIQQALHLTVNWPAADFGD